MTGPSLRIDRWLVHARFARTRGRAAAMVAEGAVRLNRSRVDRTSVPVVPGDVLTLAIGDTIRAVEVLALGARRGPAQEAALLYRILAPSPATSVTGNGEAVAQDHPGIAASAAEPAAGQSG